MKTGMVWGAVLLFVASAPQVFAADDGQGTTVDLSVSVNKPVMQDTLHASLYYRAEGESAAGVQETINKTMRDVWTKASANPAIKARLTGYRVWFVEDRRSLNVTRAPGEKDGEWVGNQSISMESKDFAALKNLVGALQHSGMVMSNIAFSVSPALRERTQDELMPSAAEKLRHKARLLADAFGAKLARFDQISLQGAGRGPVWAEARVNGLASSGNGNLVAPVAEPVEETVSLTLGGQAVLTTVFEK